MGSVIDCFMLKPTARRQEHLRRYAGVREGVVCPGTMSYHNAVVVLNADAPVMPELNGDLHPHDDPLWPKTCSCGYVFRDEDAWQLGRPRLYQRSDTGERIILTDAPPGAMWYADWYSDNWKGPDGRCLVVKTPGGDWIADAPSSSGAGWTRTGVPPMVTAKPSIGQRDLDKGGYRYHGFLTNGQLVEC